jgi:hypothetical protein
MALDISRVVLGDMQGGTNYATYEFPVTSGVTVTAGDFRILRWKWTHH